MNRVPCDGAIVPSRPKDIFFIDPIKAGARFEFKVWSPAVWGVWTHYHDATTPCYENHDHCAAGHDPKTLRWKGYIFGFHMGLGKSAYLQLTPAVVNSWWEQVADGTTMRGLTIIVSRGPKKNSPLRIVMNEYMAQEAAKARQDLHPRPSLYHLWKTDDPGWKWAKAPMRAITDYGEPPPKLHVS